jgi:hypothetical protein
MKTIPLTKGRFALVDDLDYPWLSKLKWCFSSDGYAVNFYADEYGKRHRQSMHRMIMAHTRSDPLPHHIQVDHINRDRTDNRRCNLRYATRTENQANKDKQKNNQSGYKGVSWHKTKWEARIKYGDKKLYLGRYDDPFTAALVYDCASCLLYTDFAGVNFTTIPTPAEVEQIVQERMAYLKAKAA